LARKQKLQVVGNLVAALIGGDTSGNYENKASE
jgi:hypothetical protein